MLCDVWFIFYSLCITVMFFFHCDFIILSAFQLSISNNNGDGQHDADQEALQGPSPFPREKDWERLYVRGGGGDLWIGAG